MTATKWLRIAAGVTVFVLSQLALSAPAHANPATDAQQAELVKLRARIADQVQLSAFDLLDELVLEWLQTPPFTKPTAVFLASMTVPVGLGTGLQALLENHLAALLLANPSSRVKYSHCPSCTATLVHSGPKGTVVSLGLDNPEALARIGGAGGRHGLHIDITAEGAWLVLRARITQLTPDLPIVWSRTLSTAAGTPSLLRSPTALKSAEDARKEYLDALQGRGPFTFLTSVGVRSYASGASGITPTPVIWLQAGLEVPLTQARAWSASFVLGGAWLPDAYIGVMAQARVSRLISGNSRSLTHPNVYLFLGTALMTLDGPAVGVFRTSSADQLLRDAMQSVETRATFGALHLGVQARVGNRVSASVFFENMPHYLGSDRIGILLDPGIIDIHSVGAEVSLCF